MKIAIREDSETYQKVQSLKKMGFKTPTDVVNEAIRLLYRQKMDEAAARAAKLQAEEGDRKEGPDMMVLQGLGDE